MEVAPCASLKSQPQRPRLSGAFARAGVSNRWRRGVQGGCAALAVSAPRSRRRAQVRAAAPLCEALQQLSRRDVESLRELLESLLQAGGQETFPFCRQKVQLEALASLPAVSSFFSDLGCDLPVPQRVAWVEAAAAQSEHFDISFQEGWMQVLIRDVEQVLEPRMAPLSVGEVVEGLVLKGEAEELLVDVGCALPSPVMSDGLDSPLPGQWLQDLVVLDEGLRRLAPPWRPPSPGQVMEGRVVAVADTLATVDIASSLFIGNVHRRWWRHLPKVGERLTLLVLRVSSSIVELREQWPQESLAGLKVVPLSDTAERGDETVVNVVSVAGKTWQVLDKKLPDVSDRVFAGAVLVGRVLSLNGILVDVAEKYLAQVGPDALTEPMAELCVGRALHLRVLKVDHQRQLIRARQLHPSEMGADSEGQRDEVALEDLLCLPQIGSCVQSDAEEAEGTLLLRHPPCHALLKAQSEKVTILRVSDIVSVRGLARPVVLPASEMCIPTSSQRLPEAGALVRGVVTGFSCLQLPDGTFSNGLLIALREGQGFWPTESRWPLGMSCKLTVQDFVTEKGRVLALLSGDEQRKIKVGHFYSGRLVRPKAGNLWLVDVGESRPAVINLPEGRPGQEVLVRLMGFDMDKPAYVRPLVEEELGMSLEQLREAQRLASPLPRVGFEVSARCLGRAGQAAYAPRKVEPQLLEAVLAQVEEDDLIVELEAIPCLGVVGAANCFNAPDLLLAGSVIPNFRTVNIYGIGLGSYVQLGLPRRHLSSVSQGDVLSGVVGNRVRNRLLIDVGVECRRKMVFGRWDLESPEDLRCASGLSAGSWVGNLTVLKCSLDPPELLVSAVAREPDTLVDGEVVQGRVGLVAEYGIFFEVGCRRRVLARPRHLLRPLEQYSEGQLVRRLFVFRDEIGRPALSEGGPAPRQQATEVSPEALGLPGPEVPLQGVVVSRLPYGLVLELQNCARDAFLSQNLCRDIEAYPVGTKLVVQVLSASFAGDIQVRELGVE
ncbi:unnamed protein product [Effrenium voratum]|nr:unnamed protein product [Effrenium voratum]